MTTAAEPQAPPAPPPTPANIPPIDASNPLLGETQAMIATALLDSTGGQRCALTIRTASTTLTVFLNQDDAKKWAEILRNAANQMSGSGLIVPTLGQVKL